jgi:hypothetical protein
MLVSLIDFVPRMIIKGKPALKPIRNSRAVPKYLIMPTVYGDISYLQNITFLKKYRANVLICTSKHETQEFYTALRKVCRKYGFRYVCADLPTTRTGYNKNAYTIYKGVFSNLRNLKVPVNTPCILIDADTIANNSVNSLVKAFIKSELDIASLRCEVLKPKSIIQKLQEFEYKLAMDNRRMDPWLTSGACNIAKASVYKKIFAKHSDFFAGGDIEIGKIAAISGLKIGHIDFTFFTEVPVTLKDWYKQRIIWFAGGFRHHVANVGSFGWHHFFMLFYNSMIVYLLLPLRWVEVLNYPFTIGIVILISWLYTYILMFNKGWRKEYLLLPFYSAVQTMFIVPVAIARYIKLSWNQKSIGILKYDLSRYSLSSRSLFAGLNLASALIIICGSIYFTAARLYYWSSNDTGYLTQLFKFLGTKI